MFFSITMIPSTLLMAVKSYLERKTSDNTLTWSPDLNIIEAAVASSHFVLKIWWVFYIVYIFPVFSGCITKKKPC